MPKKVDPVRISHNVKKNILKENAMYEKPEDMTTGADVALTSRDMEVNFSNKQDDDDDLDTKMAPSDLMGDARLIKADSMEIIDDSELKGVVQGVPEDIQKVEKVRILEEQKD